MDYKDEIRKLIDIVKQQSFTAPLEQTLDDMKTITNAVKNLSDRIDLRVRKSRQPTDKEKVLPKPNPCHQLNQLSQLRPIQHHKQHQIMLLAATHLQVRI